MKIMRTIWGDDSEKKQGSSKVAERLSQLLAADHTKLSAIVGEDASPAESFETPSPEPRPVNPAAQLPAPPAAPGRATAADTIARATHEALEKLQALQLEIEASFRNRTEEHQRTLLKLASNALQRSGFQQRVIKTAADELEETVKGHLSRAARQMREQAEAARASLEADLRTAHEAFLAQAREQSRIVAAGRTQTAAGPAESERAARVALATIAQATEQAVTRLAAAQKEIEAKFQSRMCDFDKRMIEAAAEELGRKGLSTKVAQQAMKELESRMAGAQESAERSAREMREQAEGLLGRLRGSNQTLLEEARKQLAAAARPIIDEQIGAARCEVETARDSLVRAVEQALEKLGAARKEIEAGFEARAREEQKRLVEAAAEEFARQGASGKLVEQTTAELERAARELLIRSTQELRRQAEAAHAALDNELRGVRESILAEVRQQLSTVALPGASEAAIATVRRAAEQAVAQLDAAQKDSETNLQKRADEFEKRLVEAATKELGRKGVSTKLLEQATTELESRVAGAKESVERSAREMHEQAEGLLGQLRGSNETLLEGARREADAARDSLARAVEQALARLAATQKELETGFATRAREEQTRLVEAAAAELGRKGLPEQVTQQAKAEIERAAHEFIAESAEQLRGQAEIARGAMDEELRASRESFLAEARAELAQAVHPARQEAEAAAHSITEAAEQALTRLAATQREIEARFKHQSEQNQKRLVDAATEELERQGVSERLIQRASKDLERSAGELLVRAAGELRRQAETARSALDEQLRVSRESFVIEVRQRLASAAQPTIEEHVEAVRQNAQAAVLSLTQASQQAMAGLTAAQRELELGFKAEAKQHQQRLVEGAAEELKRQGISQQIIGDAIAQLEQATRDFVDRSSQELRQQAVATLGAVEQQLHAKTETLIADTHEEIASLIRKPREILQQMLNDALARVVDQLRAEQAELIRKEQAPLRRQLVYLDALTQEERQRASGGRPLFSGKELRGVGLLAGVAIFAMVMVGWAAYFASRPVMQFRSDAPAGFAEENQDWSAKRQAREEMLARAYWTAALRDVQSNDYSFGAPLPNDPPPDFAVNDKTLPDTPRARGRYWSKFRQYWTDPESWQTESGSRVQWIQESANWLVAALKRVPWSSTIQYNLTKLMNKFQLWWFSHGGDI
jgi:uncharacterized protein YciI